MKQLNYERLKSEIGNPYWKQSLSPLWIKFNGAHTPHRHRANFLSIYAMFLAECETYREGGKLLKSDEMYHVCGRHTMPNYSTLMMMNGRIQATPSLANRYQGFADYLEMIGGFAPMPRGYWIERKDEVLAYPYIRGTPKDEHVTLLEIHKLLPKYLPPDHKGEICQDIFVALLSGETTMANLPDHIGKYVKASRKNMPEYGTISLDETNEYGQTRLERMEHVGVKIKCC